jgi:UDP-glucose:glycoprotein glucosyltransferase
MDTLGTAKTIDLCNNPLTKTPKLEVARTLLPEWTVLDEQAKAIEAEWKLEQQQQQQQQQQVQ